MGIAASSLMVQGAALSLAMGLVALTVSAADPLPRLGIPQSCGVQLKGNNFNDETLQKVHDMGFRIVRRGLYWNAVEKEKGKYDFSSFDPQMNRAKELGIQVIGCLFGGNKMYEDDGRGGVKTAAGREGFANFAAAAAEHYKGYNVLWEIWNEPNVRTFWRKDGMHNSDEFAQEYTDLVKATAPAMLKADPDAFIMAGSVSNYWQPSYEWTEACFKKGILGTGIRGWSVHPYGVKTPEEFAIGHEKTRALLKQYGSPDLPMLDTERGFAVKEQANNEGWSGGSKDRAREYQAWHFVRQFMIDQLFGLPVTSWYEWDGDAFGLVGDEQPRPVYTAAKVMLERLNGYTLEQRIPTDQKLDYLLVWKNSAGERQLVAWTAPPPSGSPEEARPHEVSIQTSKPVADLAVTDINGKSAAIAALKLTLSGSPQYVALPAGVELGTVETAAPAPLPEKAAGPAPAGRDLELFKDQAEWKFLKNTGEGSFMVTTTDGESIGVMNYDFTSSKAKSTPYILAMRPVSIDEAQQISLDVRSDTAQPLTFRLVDSTGQTHQFKQRTRGTGTWENIRIPLNRRLEHWDGAADGKIHFPIKQIALSLPQPGPDKKTGKVEYAHATAVAGDGAAAAPAAPAAPAEKKSKPAKPAAAKPAAGASPAGAAPTATKGELGLFKPGVEWKFIKNTGEGSFELAADGDKPIGVLNYDFTGSKAKSTPYVLASVELRLEEGATELSFQARSKVAQKLTFRIVDGTGQTLQYKTKVAGNADWEAIAIPLTRKLEHWDGDNDGKVHFPTRQFMISVPLPSEEHKQGKIEFANAEAK